MTGGRSDEYTVGASLVGPWTSRYLRYLHELNTARVRGRRYATVILSDVRDVVFQLPPEGIPVQSLHVFLEDPSRTIGSCPFNAEIVRAAYGDRGLGMLEDKLICCSGVTIGTQEAILRYLKLMVSEIVALRHEIGGVDQAIHNWLLYSGQLDPVTVHPNGRSSVLTLGRVTTVQREGHTVHNDDGSLPAIVHQYDRHPDLERAVTTRYRNAPAWDGHRN
jgi:hypothetical protein